jgi:hypothetical protein
MSTLTACCIWIFTDLVGHAMTNQSGGSLGFGFFSSVLGSGSCNFRRSAPNNDGGQHIISRGHSLDHRCNQQRQQQPFDFSSKFGWDHFYKMELGQFPIASVQPNDKTTKLLVDDHDDDNTSSLEYSYEWHPHIPHSAIVKAITPSVLAASQYYSQSVDSSLSSQNQKLQLPSILVVGCGNSALPRILHDAFGDIPVSVTCLDYSTICMDMIRSMYERACPNMNFVVGDATNLQNVIWENGLDADDDADDTKTKQQQSNKKQFDIIIDKGLLDALMCGEGFDIGKQMDGINEVLTTYEWGMHVLICFELSSASKQCLEDIPGLDWNFNIPVEASENGRGCFNLAKRHKSQCGDDDTYGPN